MGSKLLGAVAIGAAGIIGISIRCERLQRQREADEITERFTERSRFDARANDELAQPQTEPVGPSESETVTYEVVVGSQHYDLREGGDGKREPLVIAAPNIKGDVALHITRTRTWTYQDRKFSFEYDSELELATSEGITLKKLDGPELQLTVIADTAEKALDIQRRNFEFVGFECNPGMFTIGRTHVSGVRCVGTQATIWTNLATTALGNKTLVWAITQQREIKEISDAYSELTAVVGTVSTKPTTPRPQFEVRTSSGEPLIGAFVGKPFMVSSNGNQFSARIVPREMIRSTVAGRTFERFASLAITQVVSAPVVIVMHDATASVQYAELPSDYKVSENNLQRIAQTNDKAVAISRQFRTDRRSGQILIGGGPLAGYVFEFFQMTRADGTRCLITLQYRGKSLKDYEANFPKYAATIDSLLGEFTP